MGHSVRIRIKKTGGASSIDRGTDVASVTLDGMPIRVTRYAVENKVGDLTRIVLEFLGNVEIERVDADQGT